MSLALSASSPKPEPSASAQVYDRLEAARRVIESRFLAAGEFLSLAAEGIGALIASLEKLIEAIGTDSVRSTADELLAAAGTLISIPGSQANRRDTITRLRQTTDRLADRVAEMRKSLSYMNAFALYIKITAAGISSVDSDFGHFAADIGERISAGRAELETFESDLAALRRELDAAEKTGSIFDQSIGRVIPQVPDALSSSARIMSDHHNNIQAAASRTADLARDIRKRIARTLAGLQVGDITRQRIEHVQASLMHLDQNAPHLSGDQYRRLCAVAYSLQSAQLSAAANDFVRESSVITGSMRQMADDARELLQLSDVAYGRSSGSEDGFLTDLEQRIAQAFLLASNMETVDRAALAAGQTTADGALQLASRVEIIQTIRTDVQFMALNTTIKCCQIGDVARPLSVIAVELSTHSEALEKLTGYGQAELKELLETAQSLAGNATIVDDDDSLARRAVRALERAANRIREAVAQTEADIKSLSSEGQSVIRTLDGSRGHLDFDREIGKVLEETAVTLRCDDSQPIALDETVAATARRLLQESASRYTMAQERAVHAAALKRWNIPCEEPLPVQASDNGLEDALF